MTARDAEALAAIFADLDLHFTESRGRAPGAVAAIVRGDAITAVRAFGCANLMTGLRWSEHVPGRIASVSKPMAAQVILSLCDARCLSLDMRLGEGLSLSPVWAELRLCDALSMKAGLPDEYPLMALATGGGVADHHDLDHRDGLLAAQSHLNFPPGARTVYANTGYTLAQRLAEALTGERFGALLQRIVFDPAGMRTASFGRETAPLAPGIGLGARFDGANILPVESWIEIGAAGGVVASVADLVAWHLWNRGGGAELWRRIAAPVSHADGSASGYALGVERKTLAGQRTQGHAGGISGWACDYVRLLDLDSAVFVLSNRTDVNWYERIREAAVRAFELAPDPAATPRLVRPDIPTYLWSGLFGDREGGRSYHLRGASGEIELEARRFLQDESGVFVRTLGPEPIVIEVAGDAAEAPSSVSVREGGVTAVCGRARPIRAPHVDLCGVYRAATMPGRIIIAEIDGAPHVAFGWQWPATAPLRLEPVFPDLWRAFDARGAPSDFHFFWPDLDGDPDRLEVSTARLIRFPYVRVGDAAVAERELTWTARPNRLGAAQ